MDKETFVKMCEFYKAHFKNQRKTYEGGVDLINFSDNLNSVISILLKEVFRKEYIVDCIIDYVLESWDGQYLQHGKQHKVNSFEELWEFIGEEK